MYTVTCKSKDHSINKLPNYPQFPENLDFTPNGQLSYGKCIYNDFNIGPLR